MTKDEAGDGTEPITARLAQAGVQDPDVYREVQQLEQERQLAEIEAEKRRLESKTTAQTVLEAVDVNELVSLVSDLVRLGAEIGSDRGGTRPSAREQQAELRTETESSTETRAEAMARQTGNQDQGTQD